MILSLLLILIIDHAAARFVLLLLIPQVGIGVHGGRVQGSTPVTGIHNTPCAKYNGLGSLSDSIYWHRSMRFKLGPLKILAHRVRVV